MKLRHSQSYIPSTLNIDFTIWHTQFVVSVFSGIFLVRFKVHPFLKELLSYRLIQLSINNIMIKNIPKLLLNWQDTKQIIARVYVICLSNHKCLPRIIP